MPPVVFMLPEIHARPTGGNLYNRDLADRLGRGAGEGGGPVERWVWGAPPPRVDAGGAVYAVDSLLLQPEVLDAASRAAPGARLVLMVHYLALLNPAVHPAPAVEREVGLLPWFNGFVTTSRFARRGLLDHGVPAEKVAVVPPGLPGRYRAPYVPRPKAGPPRLLTVSSLLPGKGLPELVDTLEAIADHPWRWEGVGDDTLDPGFARRFAARLARSPVADRLRWRGPCDPRVLPARYRAADVFVLPSRFETLSMATREAMACGCPIVAYRVGGVPENLPADGRGDGRGNAAGYLAPPGDAAAFRDALVALLADPTHRRRMGRAAHAAARAFPGWTASARLFAAFLGKL